MPREAYPGEIDPRLTEALDEARSLPAGKARDVKLAALLTEESKQQTEGYSGLVYDRSSSGWDEDQPLDTPVAAKTGWDSDKPLDEPDSGWDEDKPLADDPSFGRRLMQAGVDMAGMLGEGVLMTGAGAIGALGKSARAEKITEPITDYLFSKREDLAKATSDLVLSPEEREAGGTGEKIAANVLAMAPLVPLGVGGVAAMGLSQAQKTGATFVDAGEDTGKAVAAGFVQGGTTAAGLLIPAFGRTVGHTAGLILTNPLMGAAADKVTAEITDNEQLKKSFAWDDPVARGTELVSGGLFGAAAHYKGKAERIAANMKYYENRDPHKAQLLMKEFETEVGKMFRWNDLPDPRLPERFAPTDETLKWLRVREAIQNEATGAWEPMVQSEMAAGKTYEEALVSILNTHAQNLPPEVQAALEGLAVKDPQTGQDWPVNVVRDPNTGDAYFELDVAHILELNKRSDVTDTSNMERKGAETWDEAYQRIFNFDLTDEEAAAEAIWRNKDINAAEAQPRHNAVSAAAALEILFHVAETPYQQSLAKFLFDQAADLGLNLTDIISVDSLKRIRSAMPNAHLYAGLAMGGSDTIALKRDPRTPSVEMKQTILHEITHSLSMNLLYHAENIRKKVDAQQKLDPAEQRLHDAGIVESYTKLTGFMEFLVNQQDKDFGKLYGTQGKSPHELFAELFGDTHSTELRDHLRNFVLEPADMAKYMPKLNLDHVNRFFELARLLRGPGFGNKPTTALDVAIAHFFGMMQHNNLEIRTEVTPEPAGGRNTRNTLVGKYKDTMKDFVKSMRDNPYQRHLYERLTYALQSSRTFDMFLTQASLISDAPEWKQFLLTHGATIYSRSDMFMRWRKVTMPKMETKSHAERLLSIEKRTWWEFLKDNASLMRMPDGSLADDLNVSVFGLYFNNPNTIRRLTKDDFAGRTVKFLLDKGDDWAYSADKLFVKLYHPVHVALEKLPSKHDQAKLFNAMQFYNNFQESKNLERKGLLWATEDMMRQQHGLNDAQIEVYKALTNMYDGAWDLAMQAWQLRPNYDGTDPKRIPGYLPNFHDGSFKVFVQAEVEPGKIRTVQVKGFNTAWMAKRYAKAMIKQGFGVERFGRGTKKDLFKVTRFSELENPLIVSLQEGLSSYFQLEKLGLDGVKALQEAEDASMHDMIKHFKDREWIGGYVGEGGAKPTFDTKTPGGMQLMEQIRWHVFGGSKAFKIHERYLKGVTEAWKNAMFLNNELQPMMSIDTGYFNGRMNTGSFLTGAGERGNEGFRNLHKYLAKFGLNYVGKEINELHLIDAAFERAFLYVGLPATMPRTLMRGFRNGLSMIKLRINPANWVMNAIQPTHMLSWLYLVNSEMGHTKDPSLALAKLMASDFKPDDDLLWARQRARENRLFDPQLQMEISSSQSSRRGPFRAVAEDVETFGRATAFSLAYLHFRDMLKDSNRAYEAAQLAMQQIQVNYDQHSRPLMYQNLGITGQFMVPFAVFRNAYYGNTYLIARHMFRNPKAAHAYKPFLASQLTYWATAGAMGVIGFGEYNMLADIWNELFPEEAIPRAEDMLFSSDMPDWLTFGPLSTTITPLMPGVKDGSYIGPSGAAVSIDDVATLPMSNFVKAVKDLAVLGVKTGKGLATGGVVPSYTELYPVGRQFMPPVAQGAYDAMFQGPGSDTAFSSTGLKGAYHRNEADQWAIAMWGKQSIPETKQRAKERELKRIQQRESKMVLERLVQIAADKAEGLYHPMSHDNILSRIGELGVSEKEFMEKVKQSVENRRITAIERETEQGRLNPSSARRQERRERLGLE